MQDAYVSESNTAGSWTLIGYTKPTSTNFSYEGDGIASTAAVSTLNATQGFLAKNLVGMNDCAANKCFWQITMTGNSDGNGIDYKANLSTEAQPLSASFGKLSHDGVAGTYSSN